MAKILLRNRQLLIDGRDVSNEVAAGGVTVTLDQDGLATVTVKYVTTDFEAELEAEVKSDA